MQGQKSAIGSLPDSLGFNHGSSSAETGIDQQMCWNNLRGSAQNLIPDYMVSSNETGAAHGWSLGESSSSMVQNQVIENDPKPEHLWSSPMSGFLSLNSAEVNMNTNHNHSTGKGLFMQGSSSGAGGFVGDDTDEEEEEEDDDDDCLVMECVTAYKSEAPATDRAPSGGSTFAGPQESDGRRSSCKRKTLEGHVGQSSGSGSSSYFHHPESAVWHAVAAQHNTNTNTSPMMSSPDLMNPRLGLSIGTAAASEAPIGLIPESSRRNFRLRINTTHQQESMIPQNLFLSNPTVSSDRQSSRLLNNNMLNLQPGSVTYNGNPQGPLRVPTMRPSTHPRWNLGSSSRSVSPVGFPLSGERDFLAFDDPTPRGLPRNVSQHPMFTPASDIGTANQPVTNWGLPNVNVGGNVGTASRAVSSSGAHLSPSWTHHRNPPQYPRRLSEFVRRSLLSSVATDTGMAINNPPQLSGSSPTLQEAANHGHRASSSRSTTLLERHFGASSGAPYSWRGLAASGEGRSRLFSEIRNVLDLMRRGENLRIEDVMLLDHSILFGMADIHDRHRDMRLDVDNMTYEELLALEERIGSVCTGLSEETIVSRLKHQKYTSMKAEESVETEPCCICQEEYNDGDDLGRLDCGHDFHKGCIQQWLKHKNLCPICKTTGLAT